MSDKWNRCSYCGKFISYKDLAKGSATRKFDTPDSDLTAEAYENKCSKCKEVAQ